MLQLCPEIEGTINKTFNTVFEITYSSIITNHRSYYGTSNATCE
ncbi:hypothetical protein LT23_02490 [Klebsiella pneumoniae]|nr:hypothetical protein LT23_02490 [Klebsiella pneumoniae]SXD70950.1 Uncharacterised protein [Klebsiella variicola]